MDIFWNYTMHLILTSTGGLLECGHMNQHAYFQEGT